MTLSDLNRDFDVTAFFEVEHLGFDWSGQTDMGQVFDFESGPSLTYASHGFVSISLYVLLQLKVKNTFCRRFDCEERNRMACAIRSQIFCIATTKNEIFQVHVLKYKFMLPVGEIKIKYRTERLFGI